MKKFRLHWSEPVYGIVGDKIIFGGLSYFSEGHGFSDEDRKGIDELNIGQAWVEGHPIGPGLIVKREE